jgi:hypothetical protein
MVGYQAVRLTQQAGVSSSGSSAATTATDSCELHPISGFVLCFCKEVVAFESVYQDLLEIAVSLLHVICFCRSSLCVCVCVCVIRDVLGMDRMRSVVPRATCPPPRWPWSPLCWSVLTTVTGYISQLFVKPCFNFVLCFSDVPQDGLIMRLQVWALLIRRHLFVD